MEADPAPLLSQMESGGGETRGAPGDRPPPRRVEHQVEQHQGPGGATPGAARETPRWQRRREETKSQEP